LLLSAKWLFTFVLGMAIGFGLCTWDIGKRWGSGERIVAFEGGPDSEEFDRKKKDLE